ncbi:Serine/threonine-protein kinase 19 [Linnemannia schmuckeri]|uniref:Serine/threonine-protein kinase 19 n=1 Tax=Linnemannia schmuckeri TaxID=64567 RepID=A0A9P5S9S0_9FUNG|nr:Serine/threonine-protein kinase 19 [Linnemannia schmuckeri]
MVLPSSATDPRRRQRGQSSTPQRRHQFPSTRLPSTKATATSTSASAGANAVSYPTDTFGTINYLLNLLKPEKVRQQKQFPRVCMIHQIYSILTDHTTVDRTLAQLIKDGTLRKFYIGGTGSDEFAIMLTEDYIHQIDQAKEQYLKDLKEAQEKKATAITSTSSTGKRKLDSTAVAAAHSSTSGSNKRRGTVGAVAGTRAGIVPILGVVASPGSGADEADEGEIFDRFKELVSGGHCMEISIQHSNIQDTIGATDQDITTLIRYSLLNRSLSAPANPHLINLEASATRHANSTNNSVHGSNSAGSHSALNQLITATNQQHAKSIRADTPSSLPTSAAAGTLIPTSSSSSIVNSVAVTTAITDATARKGRTSDDVAYRFAIRQGGLFVTHFLKGRLEILRMIKRQMFSDMLTSAITSKPLRGSFLPHEFHIHDLVGSGRVQSITTSSGQLLKLTQKGEASAKAG